MGVKRGLLWGKNLDYTQKKRELKKTVISLNEKSAVGNAAAFPCHFLQLTAFSGRHQYQDEFFLLRPINDSFSFYRR